MSAWGGSNGITLPPSRCPRVAAPALQDHPSMTVGMRGFGVATSILRCETDALPPHWGKGRGLYTGTVPENFTMRDPYEVLGVGRNADAAAIKSAFRKLAKKLHPDANTKDPKAAQRFAELNSAYEILGEDDKRKAFDRGEIDADGKPRFRGFEGFGRQRGGAGHAGPDIDFEQFSFGPEGAKHAGGRAGGFGNFEDV